MDIVQSDGSEEGIKDKRLSGRKKCGLQKEGNATQLRKHYVSGELPSFCQNKFYKKSICKTKKVNKG
jgi:hypothetical protein